MSEKNIWEWLNIEPTTETAVIKSAYASQLKLYHPEEHPDEFQELQMAYKSALKYAKLAGKIYGADLSADNKALNLYEKSEPEPVKQPEPEPAGLIEPEPAKTEWQEPDGKSAQELLKEMIPEQPQTAEQSDIFDYRKIMEDELCRQYMKDFSYFVMNPYLRNNIGAWEIFLDLEKYSNLYKDESFYAKIMEKICSMWGFKIKTLDFFEKWFTEQGAQELVKSSVWRRKKSVFKNMFAWGKGWKTVKQKSLEKIIRRKAETDSEYIQIYLKYASENEELIVKNYKENRGRKREIIVFLLVLIIFRCLSCMADDTMEKKRRAEREQRYQQERIENLRENLERQQTEE